MAYKYYNPNPKEKEVGDCVIRAIAIATDRTWDEVYWDICQEGFEQANMPSANEVWGWYLLTHGFTGHSCESFCRGYTVEEFARQHPHGTYILATGTHAVAVKNGNYIDAWDSGQKPYVYFFQKEE